VIGEARQVSKDTSKQETRSAEQDLATPLEKELGRVEGFFCPSSTYVYDRKTSELLGLTNILHCTLPTPNPGKMDNYIKEVYTNSIVCPRNRTIILYVEPYANRIEPPYWRGISCPSERGC
jgi:hypothetical protein